MKTIGRMIDDALLRLGINPSELSEPERRMLVEDFHNFENEVLQHTRAATGEHTLVLESGVRKYRLPPEAIDIDNLTIDGTNVTGCRTSPANITVL